MSAWLKIIIGALLVIGGIYWYFVRLSMGTGLTNWQALVLAFKSVFGVLVFLIGAFIVWLEADELKVRRDEKKDAAPEIQQTSITEAPQSEADKIRAAVVQGEKKEVVLSRGERRASVDYKRGRLSRNEIRSAWVMVRQNESPNEVEKSIRKPILTVLDVLQKHDPNTIETLNEYRDTYEL